MDYLLALPFLNSQIYLLSGWINPQPATSSPQTPSRREDPRPEPGSAETLINNTPQIGVHRARVEPASPTRLVGTHRVAAEKDIDEGPFADTSALAAVSTVVAIVSFFMHLRTR